MLLPQTKIIMLASINNVNNKFSMVNVYYNILFFRVNELESLLTNVHDKQTSSGNSSLKFHVRFNIVYN